MTDRRRTHRGPDALDRVVRRSRAAMALESFTRAFWPLAAGVAFLWAALAFGLAELLTRAQLVALLTLAAAALLALLVLGLRRFRWPTAGDARSRIDDTLPGRPLDALRDTPALGRDDPAAQGVWSAHLARMRRLAAGARPVAADLRLAAFDPWALRLLALVLLLAAVLFARDRGFESVTATLRSSAAGAVAAGPTFEGWAEPPAYTGRPTLYLPEVPDGAPVSVPQGTIVTLRVYGASDRFALAEDVSGAAPSALAEAAPGIAAATFPVASSGTVALDRGGAPVGRWTFAMEPDTPPTIALVGRISQAPAGETRIGFAATDDHGITAAAATIALDLSRVDRRYGLTPEPESRPALTADLPLPLSGRTREVQETLVEDFSRHPFAGLPVTVTLTAEDAIGQTGTAGPIQTVLPARHFYDPLAAAIVEQRRDLLWSAVNAPRVVQVLRATTNHPDAIFNDPGAYLIVRTAIRRLDEANRTGTVAQSRDEIAEALWKAAVAIEDGDLGDAAARLARARERLQEALRNDASDDEIARLMDELRQASRDYMEQMARDALQRGEQQAQIPPGQTMTQDQIQQLMDRIQELSEQGRKAEAEALLDMLQQLLDNMQMMIGRNQGGEGQQGEGQDSMQGLADALREQQGLADESFRQLQDDFRRGRPGDGQPGGQPGQGEPGQGQGGQAQGEGQQPGDQTLADRQEALRQLMEELQKGLPGAAGDAAREALRQAERDMGEARDGLRNGDPSGALDQQAQAIDNLREGMRAMGEDLRQAQNSDGVGDQGAVAGSQTGENGQDPLGRPIGQRGSVGTNESMVPGIDSAARARALLDEIRRRSGDLSRPPLELDYLRRLLDWF